MDARYLTAQEIAEAAAAHGVAGCPRTKRGVNQLAAREGWANMPATLARPRKGRAGGGGLEYHISLLPPALQAALGHTREVRATSQAVAVREDDTRRQVATLSPVSLGARQRQVMEARGQVLTAIAAVEAARGMSRSEAIGAFVGATALGEAALWEHFGVQAAIVRTANDRAGRDLRVGRSTLYGWFKAWEAEGGVAALAPRPSKEAAPLPPGFREFLRFYARPSKPEVTRALEDYMATVTDPAMALTIDQVRHALRVKLSDIERNVGREGLLTLRARLPYISRSTENLWPTTIYTADGHTFDAEVMDAATRRAIRPEITTILDVATRRCVGLAISRKENTVAVTEALKNACLAHGVPAIFYTDRGAGYRNQAMDADVGGLMGRLSITKMHALPYNSQAKGLIERFHGSVWVPLARKLPSYIGVDQDKEAKKTQHQASRRDLATLGASSRLPSWDEFRAMIEGAAADYNARPHSALPKIEDPVTGKRRHMSPDEAWAAHVAQGFEPILVESELRDDLFRPYEERTASRGIVRWNTNEYFHEALVPYHGERVLVGYDDADARHVWVREIDRASGQPGPLVCVAVYAGNQVDYVPVSAQRKAEERRAKGRLARLQDHVEAVREELEPTVLIEARAAIPMPSLDQVEPTLTPLPVALIEPQAVAEPANAATPASARRRTFGTDEELAAWALLHPDELTANQVRALRGCLATQNKLDLLRLHDVDAEALRALLRGLGPAAPTERKSA